MEATNFSGKIKRNKLVSPCLQFLTSTTEKFGLVDTSSKQAETAQWLAQRRTTGHHIILLYFLSRPLHCFCCLCICLHLFQRTGWYLYCKNKTTQCFPIKDTLVPKFGLLLVACYAAIHMVKRIEREKVHRWTFSV